MLDIFETFSTTQYDVGLHVFDLRQTFIFPAKIDIALLHTFDSLPTL